VARGDIITLGNGAQTLRPTADAARSIVVNNRNNGNVYVGADELPDTKFFDYIVGPETTARLPGWFRETVGFYYQDLSGAGTAGQIEWYRSDQFIDAPQYGPLGSAPTTSFANVDLAQVATPSAPATGFSRLFASAVDQQLWYELPSGVLVPVSQQAKLQLNSVAASDLLSGAAAVTGSWQDVTSATNFTVDDANSVVEVSASMSMQWVAGALGGVSALRVTVDNGASSQQFAAQVWPASPGNMYQFVGTAVLPITGLSAATHTVKLQYYGSNAATLYCRPSSQPNTEWATMRVMEFKR
jgi:hypothetical protein